jgi:nitroreductase
MSPPRPKEPAVPRVAEPPLPDHAVAALRAIIESRRSVRRFTDETIPEDVVQDCLDLALLAPNSSNLQMWEFHRVHDPAVREALVTACFGQNAASTAAEMIGIVGRTATWQRHCREILDQWPGGPAPKVAEAYYKKAAPFVYNQGPLGLFGPFKRALMALVGLFRPVPRWPLSRPQMREWAAKSCALAAENLMLALRAHGYDSCPMEGFDNRRAERLLKLPRDAFLVMFVAAGRGAEDGIYQDRFRLPRDRFLIDV